MQHYSVMPSTRYLTVETCQLDLENIEVTSLARLYRYWLEKCRGRFAPSRGDIDPLDLPYVLPQVLMFDVIDGGRDFRVRLAGTGVCALHSGEVTGLPLSSFRPVVFRDRIMQSYRSLVRTCRPVYVENSFLHRGQLLAHYRCLRLPLSEDGARVNIILVAEDYGAFREKLAEIIDSD